MSGRMAAWRKSCVAPLCGRNASAQRNHHRVDEDLLDWPAVMLTEHINLSGGPLTVYLCVCYLGCGLL